MHVNHRSTPNLGAAMKQRRKALGLNLSQLAELSNVSRSMLSEIERGNANPTFTNLWNITQALGVSIDELAHSSAENQPPAIERQDAINTPRMHSEDKGCELVALNPVATATEFEWYQLIIQPGSQLESDAHVRDTQEHLSVIEGQMTVILHDDVSTTAAMGDTLRYPADIKHCIKNPGDKPARAFLVVHKVSV
ncbi:transcriptional regulator, XRE family with cupin sensor [Neptunomonas antarctica]|uniref:Transcriptional regulator, XRE family with cupin sensor n=1 Tax=Neptunomonas antarctica TaxID=619304 RepID=A0A1N7MFX2_9GAMM|nr:transcriptional regulator, XRE family with cupin sensor [Neptunomonas antarctica]